MYVGAGGWGMTKNNSENMETFEKQLNKKFKELVEVVQENKKECLAQIKKNKYNFNENKIIFNGKNFSKSRIFKYIDKIQPSPGIYLFSFAFSRKLTCDDFRKKWKPKNASDEIKYSPNIIKKNYEKYLNHKKKGFHPLYLGSTKSLHDRIYEHASGLNEGSQTLKKTFSLHLLQHHKYLKNFPKFKYSLNYFVLKCDSHVLKIIEGEMRKELKPIIGRQ